MIQSISTAYNGAAAQVEKIQASSARLASAGKVSVPSGTPPSPNAPRDVELPAGIPFPLDVDVGREMVGLATAQSAYKANMKVIETSSKMLEKAIDREV